MQLSPYSDSLSLRLRTSQFLTSLHNVTRRSVLQKVHDRGLIPLSLLVNTGFQVLFHSPPGVLFTFPSRYYALSVTISYLGLGGGPPASRRIPRVLRYFGTGSRPFRVRGYYPLWLGFHPSSAKVLSALCRPATPRSMPLVWLFPSLAATKEIDLFFLFLRVVRCFSSPGASCKTMDSSYGDGTLLPPGFHSDIHGSLPACGSPWLFAACHVLLRRMVPWHPPCALISLIFSSLRPETNCFLLRVHSLSLVIASRNWPFRSNLLAVQLSRCKAVQLSLHGQVLSFPKP